MLFVWMNCCDPGRVSGGSRLALYQTLSIKCPSTIFFLRVLFDIFFSFLSFSLVFVMLPCSRWSFVGVLVTFSCSADHVPDWQPRILLGMVDARWVNVKNTTTTTTLDKQRKCFFRECLCFIFTVKNTTTTTTLDKQHEKMLSRVFAFSI